MRRSNDALESAEEPFRQIQRRIFWPGLYLMLVLPVLLTLLYSPLIQWSWPYWTGVAFLFTMLHAAGLLLVPLAVMGTYTGIFADTPRQWRLCTGAAALVVLVTLAAVLGRHMVPYFLPLPFEVAIPAHQWDLKTIFVYAFQALYVGLLLVGAVFVLRRAPQAPRLLALGLVLRALESLITSHIHYQAFLPTHLAEFNQALLAQHAAARPFEIAPDGLILNAPATAHHINFNLFHSYEFVPFALVLALGAVAGGAGATSNIGRSGGPHEG